MSYVVSASPHIRSKDRIDTIMLDVIIALIPATLFGVYNFGFRALLVVLLSVGSAVGFEALFQYSVHKKMTITDLSAALTGLLLALNLPHTVPLWLPIMGSAFAIIIVKQLFGGLGQNFMNPALGARAFLLISFTGLMTTWKLDGVTSVTPLEIIKNGVNGVITVTAADGSQTFYKLGTVMNSFIGSIGGCIGETSALALILGGGYLIYRHVISYRIPVFYILTTAIFLLLIGGRGFDMTYVMHHLFSGGLMIGAFFMATDYASSPTTATGQIIMGVGCGVLTVLIRLFGAYPEGVSFAIIIMNLFVPLIDKYTIPKKFGEVAKSE